MAGSTGRFSDRAGAYAKARPGYSDGAIDHVLAGLGEAGALVAADIGAGTGISSAALAGRGVRVVAVEPDSAMREKGAGIEGVEWVDGTGEATGLDAGCADLVLCAQAFHWMDAARALPEFARVLKPGGRCAMLWNVHDLDDPTTAAYRDVVMRFAVDPPRSPWYTNEPCAMAGHDLFQDYRVERVGNGQALDEAGLVHRAASSSYLPNSGAGYDAMSSALRALFAERAEGGALVVRYKTEVHLAERRV